MPCALYHESTIHVLRDCTHAESIWQHFNVSARIADFWSTDIRDWLVTNLISIQLQPMMNNNSSFPWNLLFASLIWQIWKSRNDFVFNSVNSSTTEIIQRSSIWALHFYQNWLPSNSDSSKPHAHCPVWPKPPMDGLHSTLMEQSTNHCSNAREVNLPADSLFRQAAPLQLGLNTFDTPPASILDLLSKDACSSSVQFVDSLEALEAIRMARTGNHRLTILVHVVEMLQFDWSVQFQYIDWSVQFQYVAREGNGVADCLAKLAVQGNAGVCTFSYPPDEVLPLLQLDSGLSA
ncbi:hypothetical protein F3Y22_tig00002237pilonHSYRG00316 [Hibiscus syriacus]|uniref:RNase H type-1 domain-containing protein n=1 Tax=Hibiscus syriacus TaxID=106335 RepID=A0A6A3CSU6_HIBSY|nr:hypothetical protein F3Y22_tig00002237pilonHSYRG00316 [Hibiscus syriacus]